MRLNLHPKEFLALYNSLQKLNLESVTPGSEDSALKEVLNRMRACLISSLQKRGDSSSDDDLMDLWEKDQKEKIADLEDRNAKLSDVARDMEKFLTLDDHGDTGPPDRPYPRKAPPPVFPKHAGKYRGKK